MTDERNSAGPAEERTTSTAPETDVAAVARGGRRGLVLLPDTITTLSLVAGCFSFLSAVDGHIVRAAIMIEVSLVCDGLDGLVARASRATSAFGLEYDSLSDVIAFGVAPAALMYSWALRPLGPWALLIIAPYVIGAALRLARFNIQAPSSGGKRRFVGLPVPGAAATIAGLLFGYRYLGLNRPRALCAAMVPVALILAGLMVSRVPYPSLKGVDFRRHVAAEILIVLLVGIALLAIPLLTLFLGALVYVLSGPTLIAMGERIRSGFEVKSV